MAQKLARNFDALLDWAPRTRFRAGEAAYYGCEQEEAVLEAAADINILELQCLGHQGWNLTWDRCREKESARMSLSFVLCQNGNIQPPRSQTQNKLRSLRSLSHEPPNRKFAA